MRQYETWDDVYEDPELNYRIIWKCSKCGRTREEPAGYNEGGQCPCGGTFEEAGESYAG